MFFIKIKDTNLLIINIIFEMKDIFLVEYDVTQKHHQSKNI